jgi:hypothetical protein
MSLDHLLLHCEVACAISNVFFGRFELSWVIHRRVVDLYACCGLAVVLRVLLCKRWCFRAFYSVYEGQRMT